MIFADNCFLFTSREKSWRWLLTSLKNSGKEALTGKKTKRRQRLGVFMEKKRDVLLDVGERKYRIKDVEALQAMGATITKEADPMSAMRFRMMKADRAFWMDVNFYKNKGIAEGRRQEIEKWCIHVFYTIVKGGAGTKRWWMLCVAGKAEILILCVRGNGSTEVWAWNGFEWIKSGWQERDLPNEVVNALCGRCYSAFGGISRKFSTKRGLNKLINDERQILRHANLLWRDQRWTNARLLDPRNQNKMKRMRAGVPHTNWDSLMKKRSGDQRWWESYKGWESFAKAARRAVQKSCKKRWEQGDTVEQKWWTGWD